MSEFGSWFVKGFAVGLVVGLFFLICLGIDLLPWNREKKKEADLEG